DDYVTSRGFLPRARIVLGVCAAAILLASLPVFAEEVPAPPLPVAASPSPVSAAVMLPATNRAVLMPAGRSPDIQVHWAARREFVRERDDRRADDEEQRVRALKDDLAIENLFSVGAALVREGEIALAKGASAVAMHRCKLAVELAPALPAAHACLARAQFAESPTAINSIFAQLGLAANAAMADPRISRAEVAISLSLLVALALSPWAAEEIGRTAVFSGPAVDVWLVEHGEGTGPEIGRLQKRFESTTELPVAFALARKAKRDGDLSTAEKLYLRAMQVPGYSSAGLAAVRNN